MGIFLLTPLARNKEKLRPAVTQMISEEDRFEVQADAGWLISFPGTTVELSNHLGITSKDPDFKPTMGAAMITSVNSYYGRGSTEMWEWIKTRFERQR